MTPAGGRAWDVACVAAGGLMLAWPALLNGYPLLFSDTGAFLHQTLGPLMIWDKPFVYGPLLHVFHWRLTLWLPWLAQAAMTAWLILLVVRAANGGTHPGPPPRRGHGTVPGAAPSLAKPARAETRAVTLALCAGVALLTTAPFSVALLMPDFFAPVVVLALFLLGLGRESLGRGEAIAVGTIAALGIAAHLSHLPVAAALVALVLLWTRRWRDALRAAVPLLGAIAILLATNAVGHGRISLSPHGATFLLARLQADGPAAETIRARCPQSGWYLCGFTDRMPTDSDAFLWDPASPLNRDAAGNPRFLGGALLSREAGEIVAATLLQQPLPVAAAVLRNTLHQLALVEAGDTLGPEHLAAAVRPRIAEGFGARELAAYDDALQPRGLLRQAVAPVLPFHLPVLIAAAFLAPLALWRAGTSTRGALLVCVILGCLANAFATGALSKPVPRYEARIAWLLPFAVAIAFLPTARRRE